MSHDRGGFGDYTIYVYTPGGRLSWRIDDASYTTTYDINVFGDLASISYEDGITPSVSFLYDRSGRPQTITQGTNVTTRVYGDADGVWTNILLTTGEYIDGDGGPNPYGFARNNGLNYYDLNGLVIETGWDVFNVAQGAVSFGCNVAGGNYVGAFADFLGLGYDVLATAVPGLPAGGSTAIASVRLARASSTLVRNMYRAAEQVKNAKNLVRWAVRKGKDSGHHIVAITATKAKPARDKLRKLKIDINDFNNGVALPTKFHESLHKDAYYEMINNAALGWKTKQDAIDGLAKIAEDLLKQSGKLK